MAESLICWPGNVTYVDSGSVRVSLTFTIVDKATENDSVTFFALILLTFLRVL